MRADGLEHVLDRHVALAEPPGRDRAVVQDEPGKVEPPERHHGRRDRLVAADEADQPVEEVSARDPRHQWAVLRTAPVPPQRGFDYFVDF